MTAVAVHRPAPHEGWFPAVEPVRSAELIRYASGGKVHPATGRSETAAYLPFVAATFGLRVVVTGAWTLDAEVAP